MKTQKKQTTENTVTQ